MPGARCLAPEGRLYTSLMPTLAKPLTGILVADFSRILAGPLCTMMLADAGARVIKVEQPGRGDETRRWGPPFIEGESAYYLSVNRGKESITLDLGSSRGREIAGKLIERADVAVDNFLPVQKTRLGLTAEKVRAINRRIIHCSISGFDQDGPDADLPGYDLLAQAAGGFMAITGQADDDPTKAGVALSDVLTAHYAHGAILSALVARERTGTGSTLDVSLHGSTVASLINVGQAYLVTGREPLRWGNAHPAIVPYEAFHGSDRLMVIAVATDRHFEILCREVLEHPEVAADSRFRTNADRVTNRDELIPMLQAWLRARPAAEWIERCRNAGIPAHVVSTIGEVFEADASPADWMAHPSIGALRMTRGPVLRDGARSASPLPPPLLGEHTDSILGELGCGQDEITRMRDDGVV